MRVAGVAVRTLVSLSLLVAGLGGAATAAPVTAAPPAAATVRVAPAATAAAVPVRVLPLGDSITSSPGCWRAYLWQKLQEAAHAEVDMVGSQTSGGCGFAFDEDHEGHPSTLVTNTTADGSAQGWMTAAKADVVLLHYATNDVWSARTPEAILAAYDTLVAAARSVQPKVTFLVAKLIPVAPTGCTDCPGRTRTFNDAIPAWAAATTTAQSKVVVVDQWTGWDPATLTGDGVHPNDAGFRRMADTWFEALDAVLRGGNPPVGGACTVTSTVAATAKGFTASLEVTNGRKRALDPWQVTLRVPAKVTVTRGVRASASQQGRTVTLTPKGTRTRLAAHGSVTIGFVATGPESAEPAVVRLNGARCG